MSDLTATIFAWIDLIQVPVTVAVIVILFLKKRTWIGVFGIFMAVTGVTLQFPLFRVAKDELSDWWWWTWRGQGLVILVLLIWFAVSPPAPGSWWERRSETKRETARPPARQ